MLELLTRQDRDWTVLSVIGDLDLSTVPEMRATATPLARRPGAGMVVDLTACHHLDSVGVGLLLGIHRRCRARGGRLVVVAQPSPITRVLQATEVNRLFDVVESLEVACTPAGSAGADPMRGA